MRRSAKALLLAWIGFLLLAASAVARQFQTPVYDRAKHIVGAMVTADFSNDGILELAFTDLGQVAIMLGKGNGTFEPTRYFNVPDALQLAVTISALP